MTERIWTWIVGFFVAALLLYLGAKLISQVWWVLLIIAVIVLAVIIYIRFRGGKPKY